MSIRSLISRVESCSYLNFLMRENNRITGIATTPTCSLHIRHIRADNPSKLAIKYQINYNSILRPASIHSLLLDLFLRCNHPFFFSFFLLLLLNFVNNLYIKKKLIKRKRHILKPHFGNQFLAVTAEAVTAEEAAAAGAAAGTAAATAHPNQ